VSRQTTAVWQELLAPDGTPPALPLQVAYVRRAVWQQTGQSPSLRGLTTGQAERILAAVGADTEPLWHAGRDTRPANVAAGWARWLLPVVVCLVILDLGRIAGIPFVLVILGWAGTAFLRRQRRQAFEDRHYRRPGPAAARAGGAKAGGGTSQRDAPQAPPPGSPYNVDTYLRRLSEDGTG
jgi:hypothetical protein